MKHAISCIVLLALCSAPSLLAQSADHAEVGVFADYLYLTQTSPHINFIGVGGRAAFNVRPSVQIEAEMSYDFERAYGNAFSNGATTSFVQTRLRPLNGLFGPKFETHAGAFRAFATFKAGFQNFHVTGQNPSSGFGGSVNSVTTGNTYAAIYPGVGIEGFWGPFGLRLDAGDDIYFNSGAQNNLKVTFGPTFRF